MSNNAQFAAIASLLGDPSRAAMLHALMDGRSLTATELATAAGVTPQTASGHLRLLIERHLVAVKPEGRHRYHRLASPAIAEMIEAVMRVASPQPATLKPLRVGPRDAALRRARTCYDHFAGTFGVALADALVRADFLELDHDAGALTARGVTALTKVGIAPEALAPTRPLPSGRVLCRPCLDWSERRLHLAGRTGAAICARSLAAGWHRRLAGTRAVSITPKGVTLFRETFGLVLDSRG